MAIPSIEQTVGLNDKVYGALKDAILKKVLRPGDRLDIVSLAKHWGISRTPVNDALQRLKVDGLIEVAPRKGTYVSVVDAEQVLQMLNVREMFELYAAEHSCGQIQEGQLALMNENLVKADHLLQRKSFDYIAYTDLDIEFHTTLIQWTGNDRLLHIYQAQHFHWQTARFYYDRASQKSAVGQTEHWEIYRAFLHNDLVSLRAAISKHIQAARAGIQNI